MKKLGSIFMGITLAAGLGSFASLAYAQSAGTTPSVPANISAAVNQSGQVYISWSPSSDSIGIAGYYVYRNGQFLINTPGQPFYTDNAPGGNYTYTVAAYDLAGNVSAQSQPSISVRVVSDTIPPSAPTNLMAVPTASTVALSWTAATDNVAVVGYYVYRNGAKINTTSPITGTSYTDTGLMPGATYTYDVVAYDAAGNTTNSSAISAVTVFDVTPPSVPAHVSAVSISSSQINLTWQPSTDNVAVAGYYIYRNGSQIGTSATSSYTDGGLSPQTSYLYQVSAYDSVGNVSKESVPAAVAVTQALDVTPPSVPQYLSATAVSISQVNLAWQPSTDNVAVAGYYIYRNGSEIGETASTTYADTGLATSTTYTYAVRAYDTSGNTSAQTSVAVTTPAVNPVIVPTISPVIAPAPVLPVTPVVPSTPPVSPPTPSVTTNPSPTSSNPVFTTALYLGLRNSSVTLLQNFLIARGDLGSNYATGYFGALTQAAVQKFQCAQNIVCSGSPASTGWGFVGVHTRAALNSLEN